MVSERRVERPALRTMALLGLGLLSMGAARPPTAQEQGRQLFVGEVALVARMVGHAQTLPQQAVRCVNCHQRATLPSVVASPSATTQDFGPKLSADTLAKPVARRGGPASTYDSKAFCRLLRDGIDPAHVMIPQTMPRYVLTDTECEALWTFLMTP